MTVSGVSYSEKAEAGQAIINACKSMRSPDPIVLGEYRGFNMNLLFDTINRNYVLRLKGIVSRDVELGVDASGNILRIDNSIDRLEKELTATKDNLENTEKQFETAKQEIKKPFAREEELKAKLARLDELNILLNMDNKEVNGMSNYYDYKELREQAINNPTDENLDSLGSWCEQFGDDSWNGEYFDLEDGHKLYRIEKQAEDANEIIGYSLDEKATDPTEAMRHRDTDGDGVCDYIDSNGYTKPNDQYQYREISSDEYAKLKEAGFDLNQKCKSSPTKADCFILKCNAAESSQVDEILKPALNKAIKH